MSESDYCEPPKRSRAGWTSAEYAAQDELASVENGEPGNAAAKRVLRDSKPLKKKPLREPTDEDFLPMTYTWDLADEPGYWRAEPSPYARQEYYVTLRNPPYGGFTEKQRKIAVRAAGVSLLEDVLGISSKGGPFCVAALDHHAFSCWLSKPELESVIGHEDVEDVDPTDGVIIQ